MKRNETTAHVVWKSPDPKDMTLFSDGVTREFGENHVVIGVVGQLRYVGSAVMPLKCDPYECGLQFFGVMPVTKWADTESKESVQ